MVNFARLALACIVRAYDKENIKFYKIIVEFIYLLHLLQILRMPNTLLVFSNHHHSVFHHVFSLIVVLLICHQKTASLGLI